MVGDTKYIYSNGNFSPFLFPSLITIYRRETKGNCTKDLRHKHNQLQGGLITFTLTLSLNVITLSLTLALFNKSTVANHGTKDSRHKLFKGRRSNTKVLVQWSKRKTQDTNFAGDEIHTFSRQFWIFFSLIFFFDISQLFPCPFATVHILHKYFYF